MRSYYDHPYVSNSTLSALEKKLSGQDQYDPGANYDFGKLFHALLLEPHKVNHIFHTLSDEGNVIQYVREDFKKAISMRDAVLKNPALAQINKLSAKEQEFYMDSVPFSVEGLDFELPMRMKADLHHPGAEIIGDYKSVACKTLQEFRGLMNIFSWDRQAYLYMMLSGARQGLWCGVSKSRPHSTFPVFIKPGDEIWRRGKAKLEDLALKYFLLK